MGEAGGYPELVLYRVNQTWASAGILTEPKTHVFSPGSRKKITVQWLGGLDRD